MPGLAQSWEISKDGLTYTFKLRPNVKFHDGTAFNAEAVKFCFERQLNDKSPYYATGTYPYVKSFLGNIAGVEVVDPTTLQIKLKAQLAPFLQYLAHQSLFVYSPDDRSHVVYATGFKPQDYAHDLPLLLKFR